MKQIAELQDGECFTHTYDKRTVHRVVRQECVGGGDTGVLDCVITQEVGYIDNDVFTMRIREQQEHCNPYAPCVQYRCEASTDEA